MDLRSTACLFDLDGVLVDSRAVVERTWHRWGERHQLDVAPLLRIAHGRRARDTLQAIIPRLATDAEVAWLDAAELEDVEGLTPVPGAREFLASLPIGCWGIVTSCSRALAELRLSSVGFAVPRMIVVSGDVKHGKPAPDGYRLGAERLGVAPADCLVFEDAPPGVAAARAAGARVIGITTTHPAGDLRDAVTTVPDFTRVRARVARDALVVTTA
ncbi:MAG TPA: HAD-IA family hydrolase [Gemmatimonadales bacterium]|nr:HAD-IA family hydrolase [Gemmatimonadales bacterium]